MLKLERSSEGKRTTIRLIGRARSEHLVEIANQMDDIQMADEWGAHHHQSRRRRYI